MDYGRSALSLGILGPLEASRDGHRLDLGPFKQRVVLGMLLSQPNKVVSVATLSEALWEDAAPRTAHKNLQVYVWALRKILSAPPEAPVRCRIVHRAPGYVIDIGPDEADTLRFGELARAGREALRTDAVAATRLLERALDLWRGPVLADLLTSPALAEQAARLNEQYLDVYEDWAETKLGLGGYADVLASIGVLVQQHPFRERLRRAQILALAGAGRHTEALAQFDAMRQALARELGLGPSPVLARLYEAILAGDHLPGAEPLRPEHPVPASAPVRPGPAPGPGSGPGRDLPDFTGRAEQVRTLTEMFSAADGNRPGRIAVLSGPVGVGKTALAVRCAHLLGERFPDGWTLVSLRDPRQGARLVEDVLGDLLRALAPLREVPAGLEERAALFRIYAADRRALIVLDDVVSEAQLEAVLEAVGGAGAAIVATSRRRLSGVAGVAHVALGPLAEAEAVDLLGTLIGAERVAAEPRAARRLAEMCGGLPLALRIVGSKLAALRHVTPARYAERLADDARLLDELVVGDLQLRTRLADAYQELTSGDQAVLRALAGLDRPQFPAPDVATALGTDVGHAEAAVERLIEAHMVDVRPTASTGTQPPAADTGYQYTLSRFTRVFVCGYAAC